MTQALQSLATVHGVLWVLITFASYAIGVTIHRCLKGHPLSHPLITTSLLVGLCLFMSKVSVGEYQTNAGALHWLLGPVTVALALPIYRQWQRLRIYGWRLVVCILFGGIAAPIMAWFALYTFNAPLSIQLTMLVKSITTPLAMETSQQIGGVPALAAVFVIVTGIVGAVSASVLFRVLAVTDKQAQGLALGTVAHAVGTAKAIHIGEDAAAMAILGLCANGIVTAIVLPLLFTHYM